jgi:hypothetical protein
MQLGKVMSPAAAKTFVASRPDALEIGVRVVRCNSPADSLIADGVEGIIREVGQSDNGEMYYVVLFPAKHLRGARSDAEGHESVFCAGSRLKAICS